MAYLLTVHRSPVNLLYRKQTDGYNAAVLVIWYNTTRKGKGAGQGGRKGRERMRLRNVTYYRRYRRLQRRGATAAVVQAMSVFQRHHPSDCVFDAVGNNLTPVERR